MRVAPQQVVIVPILREDDRTDVLQITAAVADELRAANVRIRVDDRPEHRPGFKSNEWELKGVPLRIEIGGRDPTCKRRSSTPPATSSSAERSATRAATTR